MEVLNFKASPLLRFSFSKPFLEIFFSPTVGPSLDPSGVSFVDTIHVYVKSKDSFGWPEHPPPPPAPSTKATQGGAAAPPSSQGDGGEGSEVLPVVPSKDCSAMDG